MKNILSKTVLALGITAMVMAGCTENGTSEKQYVYLSDAACTFQSAGNEPFTITVETSPAVDGYARCLVGNRREIGK